jgi:glutathione S-transferase
MSLTLYYHPLSSFCWKALIALYDADIPFEPKVVDLADPAERAAFQAVWPLAKFPVLRDAARGRTTPESTIIIDYLARYWPAAAGLIPADPDAARQVRLLDRLFDSYIHLPLQQVVAERLRPDGSRDPFGADQARGVIRQGYDLLAPMIAGPWASGEAFTLADCAALPALHYADYALPLAGWPPLAAYLDRLRARPSVARVLEEAAPFFQYFPLANDR